MSITTRVSVTGLQPVVRVVKWAAALGSDVGAAVDVGTDDALDEAASVAKGDADADGDGWVETAGPHTLAVRTSALTTAIARKPVTIPADGLRGGGLGGGVSSDSRRPAA
jgi:hypothetical protein